MGLIQAFLRMLNRSLEWLFGGAGTHRQAFDMMARLERSYPAASLIVGLAFLPGLVHYDWKPAIPLIGTAVGYSLALTWPAKSRYPYLAATVSWLLGLACSMVAARLAGPPYAFLWVGAAISLPYIAVIWPARLSVAATTVLLITMGAVATLWVPERVSESGAEWIAPVLACGSEQCPCRVHLAGYGRLRPAAQEVCPGLCRLHRRDCGSDRRRSRRADAQDAGCRDAARA